eukprot:261386-Chlamydomonas_euryale.AAC.6
MAAWVPKRPRAPEHCESVTASQAHGRRELHTRDLSEALAQAAHANDLHGEPGSGDEAPVGLKGAAWTYNTVTSATIETERRELQKETTLGLGHAHGTLESDALRDAVDAAASPLQGVCL